MTGMKRKMGRLWYSFEVFHRQIHIYKALSTASTWGTGGGQTAGGSMPPFFLFNPISRTTSTWWRDQWIVPENNKILPVFILMIIVKRRKKRKKMRKRMMIIIIISAIIYFSPADKTAPKVQSTWIRITSFTSYMRLRLCLCCSLVHLLCFSV